MTIQVRVANLNKAQKWYETLLNKNPDSVPHEGFAEWELIKGCWLQVAEGTPSEGSGPIRLGVMDIEKERSRIVKELKIEPFEIFSREEVPVKWGTFSDPWGNRIGFFEYKDEVEKVVQVRNVLGKLEV